MLVNGMILKSPNFCSISKHGQKSLLEVPNQQCSIHNRQRWGKTCVKLRCNQVIRTEILAQTNPDAINSEKQLIHENSAVKRLDLPLTLEFGYSNDDDDKFSRFCCHFSKLLNAFYRFSRPHTVIGTLIGVTSVSLLPIESIADLSPKFFMGLLKALLPAVMMNIYVVGLNQLYDLQIDKVNKPNLPLASGEFTMGTGKTIVLISCLLSFAIGFASQSPPLIIALITSFFLGSAYSIDLPLLRWKKQPFLAAACIVIVRAIVVQLAFFTHFQKYVLGREKMLNRPVIFATMFMCFFATVIALFKDIPDVDGDRHFGIQSFSVSLGKEKVFWLCIKMLLAAYGSALFLGASSSSLLNKLVSVLGHSVLASILMIRAQYVELEDNVSITSFYMFIWKLFYAEYFLIPFIS